MYYFLRKDLEMLDRMIADINNKVKQSGKDIGDSCHQSAETYHDNAPYEEAVRSMALYSTYLKSLWDIWNQSQVIEPAQNTDQVRIGHKVILLDMNTDELIKIRIGSYRVFDDNAISYTSPLAQLILGAPQGHIRKGMVGDRQRELMVLSIEKEDS